jgi:hypothetical protein
VADLAPELSPRAFEVEVRLPETDSTTEQVTNVLLDVKATTGGPAPRGPENDAAGKPKPEWERFQGLKLRVTPNRDPALPPGATQEFALAADGAQAGLFIALSVADGPIQNLTVTLVNAAGEVIVSRGIAVPCGAYWSAYTCKDPAGAKAAVVHYLRDPVSAHHPGRAYAGASAADGDAPPMVVDTCKAFVFAFQELKKLFGTAPSLPVDIMLQPWRDSLAFYRARLDIGTAGAGDWDTLRKEVAHETAHKFQFLYSWALFSTGLWFHEASAEYLAHHILDPKGDGRVDAFTGTATPSWILHGVQSNAYVDAYGTSSFLAYLASDRKIDIVQLWKDGSNVRRWTTELERALGGTGKLADAWVTFARAYLLDHALWPTATGWDAVNLQAPFEAVGYPLTLSGDVIPVRGVAVRRKMAEFSAPPLSAGGQLVEWRPQLVKAAKADAATVVVRLRPRAGAGWWARLPGDRLDGRPFVTLRGDPSGKAQVDDGWLTDVFVLGAAKERLDATPPEYADRKLRYLFLYADVDSVVDGVKIEAWAIPQLLEVQLDAKEEQRGPTQVVREFRLTWDPSPLEAHPDLFGKYEVLARLANGDEKHIAEVKAGVRELRLTAAEVPDGLRELCVRARDVQDHAGPLACAAPGGDYLRGKASVEKSAAFDIGSLGGGSEHAHAVQGNQVTITKRVRVLTPGGAPGALGSTWKEAAKVTFTVADPPAKVRAGDDITVHVTASVTLDPRSPEACDPARAGPIVGAAWHFDHFPRADRPPSTDLTVDLLGASRWDLAVWCTDKDKTARGAMRVPAVTELAADEPLILRYSFWFDGYQVEVTHPYAPPRAPGPR